jgi:hypothetical protein
MILILQEMMKLDDDNDDDKNRQMMKNHNDINTKFGVFPQIMTQFHNIWLMFHVPCHNPSLGFVTKARPWKGVGQECTLGITLTILRMRKSVRE